MKIWDIAYTNTYRDGVAIVAAPNAKEAIMTLQSYERLNSNKYEVTYINPIGDSGNSVKQLISEFYKPRTKIRTEVKTVEVPVEVIVEKPGVPSIPSEPVPPTFDVDSLTDEDILKLKTRLDIRESDTLYVNRIGFITPTVLSKAKDGYTLFTTHRTLYRTSGKNIKALHLYIKRDGKFVDLGIPKQRCIKAPARELILKDNISDVLIEQFFNKRKKGQDNPLILKDTKCRRKAFFIRKLLGGKDGERGHSEWKFVINAYGHTFQDALEHIRTNSDSCYSGRVKQKSKYVIALGYIKRARHKSNVEGSNFYRGVSEARRVLMKGSPIEVRTFIRP